jgi:MFS family permease
MSLNVKPSPLTWIALGTTLVLVTYVTPLATVVATTRDLGSGPTARAWILSSMSVGLAAALLASGVLGDSLGRRRTYALGLGALALGSLGCALAQDSWVLVVARVVQGVGGAAVLSCGLATLAHVYPPGKARGHATSVWGASVGMGIAAGAALTAVLDMGSGWRPSYWATAVAAALLLVPSLRTMPDSGAGHSRRIDVGGLVLLVVAMTAAVSALTQARNGIDAATVGLVVLALVSLAAFALVERRVGQPLVDPALLASPRFRAAGLGSFVLGIGMIGMASFSPTMAILGMGAGPWGAATPVLVWAGASVVTSLLLRYSPVPLDGARPIGVLLVLVAAGQLLVVGVDESSSLARLALPFLVTGVFTGFLNGLLGREAVASVPPARAAMGSGANNTARYLGAACGITLFVTLATHTGDGLGDGWGTASLTAAALTAGGGLMVLLIGREPAREQDPSVVQSEVA